MNVLLIIAHPDDEVMFFAPFLEYFKGEATALKFQGLSKLRNQKLVLNVLCLTHGHGGVREKELYSSLELFSVPRERIFIVNDEELPDNMIDEWDINVVSRYVIQYCQSLKPRIVVTFDEIGVSGHVNHFSTYFGVQRAVSTLRISLMPNLLAYKLTSVPLYRKFCGPLEIITALCLEENIIEGKLFYLLELNLNRGYFPKNYLTLTAFETMKILDAVCLAYLSYYTPLDNKENIIEAFPSSDSCTCGSMLTYVKRVLEVDWKVQCYRKADDFGYQSIRFINEKERIIAIAYRGTIIDFSGSMEDVMKRNVTCDIRILESVDAEFHKTKSDDKKFGERDEFLTKFCKKACEFAKEDYSNIFSDKSSYREYSLVHVGHSLGGFMAELVSCYISCKFQLQNNGCLTFDSLGSEPFLERCDIKFYSMANSYHFFENPNITNTANNHVGFRYKIGNRKYKSKGHKTTVGWMSIRNPRELIKTLRLHKLEPMIKILKSQKVQIVEIDKWPHAINQFSDVVTKPSFGRSLSQCLSYPFRMLRGDISQALAARLTEGIVEFTHEVHGQMALLDKKTLLEFRIGNMLIIKQEVK